MQYTDAKRVVIDAGNGVFIPVDANNRDFQDAAERGVRVANAHEDKAPVDASDKLALLVEQHSEKLRLLETKISD